MWSHAIFYENKQKQNHPADRFSSVKTTIVVEFKCNYVLILYVVTPKTFRPATTRSYNTQAKVFILECAFSCPKAFDTTYTQRNIISYTFTSLCNEYKCIVGYECIVVLNVDMYLVRVFYNSFYCEGDDLYITTLRSRYRGERASRAIKLVYIVFFFASSNLTIQYMYVCNIGADIIILQFYMLVECFHLIICFAERLGF